MIAIGTRVRHPDGTAATPTGVGTVIEVGENYGPGAKTPTMRARVKWDDGVRDVFRWNEATKAYEATGKTYPWKGKRTWVALNRLVVA